MITMVLKKKNEEEALEEEALEEEEEEEEEHDAGNVNVTAGIHLLAKQEHQLQLQR